jgi:hypothetical protein
MLIETEIDGADVEVLNANEQISLHPPNRSIAQASDAVKLAAV